MRKLSIPLLLVMFVSLFTTTSCDDDDYYNPVVGNWSIIEPANAYYNEYCFYPDGTGTYYIDDYAGQSTYYFTWQTYEDFLYIYFNMGDTWTFNWDVSFGCLYLYPIGSPYPYVYKPF